jgi:hypothetical protein
MEGRFFSRPKDQSVLRFDALPTADAQTVRFELTPVEQKGRGQIA